MSIKKKLVSLIAAVSMLASLITTVSVSAYDVSSDYDLPIGVSYYSNTNSDGESYIPGENYILEASSAYKTSGNYSLHLAAPNEYSNVQLRIGLPLKKELSTSKTYRVTGKAVRISDYGINAWWDCVNLYYGTALTSITKVGTIVCSDNYATKGFADFSFDITPASAAKLLALYTWQGNYYIDEMSCKCVNDDGTLGEELLINGDFEVINVQAANTVYPSSWMNTYNSASADYAEVSYIASTDMDAFEGERSMLVQIPTETSNVQMDITAHLKQKGESGKTYRFEYWTKVLSGIEHGTAIFGLADGASDWLNYVFNFEAGRGADENGVSVKDGWYHKYYDFTMTSNTERALFRQWANTTALFDNFKLREKKDDGTFGENLLPNSGFEEYVDFSAVSANETYNNTWTAWTMGIENSVASDYLRFEDVGDGNYAMHMNWDSYKADNVYGVVELTNAITLPAGSYTLEYDTKMYWGNLNGSNNILSLANVFWEGDNRWAYNYPWSFATDYSENSNGWMHIKKEFTVSSETSTKMQFINNGYVDMLIDNITIKDSDGKEYILDGDFSDTSVPYEGPYAEIDLNSAAYPAHWVGMFSSSSSSMISADTYAVSTDMASHNGEYSMLIQAKEPQSGEKYTVLTDLLETTDATKTYRLEFFEQGIDGTTNKVSASIAKESGDVIYQDGLRYLFDSSEVDENGWRKYSYDFTGQEISQIGLQIDSSNSFLVDDFKLFELDSDGNTVRELVVANGDFEEYLDFNECPSEATYNDNWHIRYQGQAIVVDDYVRYEDIGGDYAMHIRYNDIKAGNTYIEVKNNVSDGQLVSGNTYTVEYDIKASSRGEENAVFFFPLRLWNYSQVFGVGSAASLGGTTKSSELLDNGFKHIVKEFTSSVSGDAVFAMLLQAQCDMIIDNIKVYESSDNTKTNLIVDGDFSETVVVDKSELENLYVYQYDTDTVTVSWTNPPANITEANVYVNDIKQSVDADTTPEAYNKIIISDLVPGETYEIKVTAVIGGEEKVYKKTVVLYENSVKVNAENASVTGYMTNASNEENDVSMIIAQYDNDGRLLDVKEEKKTISSNISEPVTETVTADAVCSDMKKVRGFIWDGSGSLKPLAESKEKVNYSKSLKILAIGNSFSVDAMEYLYQIAESYGVEEIKLGNLYIGGCALSEHWNKAMFDKADYTYYKNTTGTFTSTTSSMKTALQDEEWDIIVMQQVSGLSGIADSYEPYLTKLKDYVNEYKTNPDAELAWHMTWAYQNGASHVDFSKYDSNQNTMYNSIVQAVKSEILPDSDFDYIIPSGTAVQNVRTSYIGDSLTRDGYHLSYDFGRYIAGMTWFKTLTGFDIDGISYAPSGVSEEYVTIAKEGVNNACENSLSVTTSVYLENGIDLSGHEILDYTPIMSSYWYSTNNLEIMTDNATFAATKQFSKDEIPVGSIIVVKSGWRYRPEGWIALDTLATSRPANVTTEYVEVTDEWWGDYNWRAFNISMTSGASITDAELVKENFKIYVPKS